MRQRAVQCLGQVLDQHQSLDQALPRAQQGLPPRDAALLAELCYGVLRWHDRLRALAHRLLDKPLRGKDADLQRLLLCGLYQLLETRIPPHAAVAETVAVAPRLGKGWARGLINAVLRRAQREADRLLPALDADPATRYALPAWLLDTLRRDWPDRWQALAAANQQRPPMTLRVDLTRWSREEALQALDDAGCPAQPSPWTPTAVTLARPAAVDELPGFADGRLSVQDEAAQWAAPLLACRPGERVLDACAAPGGKTGHLLEHCPGIELTALDISEGRLGQVRANLQRLRREARCLAGDAARPETWWDGRPYQRILLDAPCSGTGVIRRHPDIRHLRRPDDIARLADGQGRLLEALWGLLAPGGRLVYATCSVLKAENSRVVAHFLRAHPEAQWLPAGWPPGFPADDGQILAGNGGMDGFYYACLHRP
ncbi:16S rRNA (cytosine(967)-C(5))-methyltransferase RsmB [Alkalilimnicola ehrlichii MLHE-1]|uniref:16S rRNA (cytosine(967)-C(5))-methyltransferase RsmB n=1 Tax=Alkalilimnicola ehrlichii TaxID=351052 RepID=UPI0006749DDF|nr:16S rRNA (cytosine(967)-C(5))-methyltransferase RsmB [Alkalilimnicola ehrlichii]